MMWYQGKEVSYVQCGIERDELLSYYSKECIKKGRVPKTDPTSERLPI